MKEVTYKEWIKNPVPRRMWVWDEHEENKELRYVIYIIGSSLSTYPVITISSSGIATTAFQHCAEIEPKRLMTHKELARWLNEKPFREFKYGNGTNCPIYKYHTYTEDEAPKEVCKDIHIREDDGPWREPLIEVEL